MPPSQSKAAVIKHPATRQPIISSRGNQGLNATGNPKANINSATVVKNPFARKPH